jgi:hypothetical protein
MLEELQTRHFLDGFSVKKAPVKCSESASGEHDWVLGMLRPQDAVWVCRNGCGAIKVTVIKYAV